MKFYCSAVLLLAGLALGLPAQATEVAVELPAGYGAPQLLSPGTDAVLRHYRTQLDRELERLDAQYQLSQRQAALKQAELDLNSSRSRLSREAERLKQRSIAQVHVRIISAALTDLGSSSTMGDITFYYTVTNSTGRIVGSLLYRPVVGQLRIPTTSSLYLDLIDFATMRFGLAPGASLSNQGTHPENLSFFVGELKGEQLAQIKRSIATDFKLEVVDLKFLRQTGFKGQTQALSFEEAFAAELGPYRASVGRSERALSEARTLAAAAARGLNAAKQQHLGRFVQASATLQSAARRYQAGGFSDVEPGVYWLYAKGPAGRVIFERVRVKAARRQAIEALSPRPDPFKP